MATTERIPRITWLIAALVLPSAIQTADINPFLAGGIPSPIGAHPAHIGINIGQNVFCGGTILNQNHILTSGSCVLDGQNNLRAAGEFLLRIGVITIDATTPWMGVIRVFVHPHYNPFTFENDIAILRTNGDMTFPVVATPHMAPAELIDRIVPENAACEVVGWNWLPGTPGMNLQQLGVTVYPRTACQTMFQGMIRDSMMCAAAAQANQGMCVANRGGGLYCNGRLTGVASFGFGCAANSTATVFTQVRYHRQWIQQQFGRADNPGPGPTPMPGVDGATSLKQSAVAFLLAAMMVILLR
ncbi:hypothetical protein quinque_000115 [Culex quinquefasciatus]